MMRPYKQMEALLDYQTLRQCLDANRLNPPDTVIAGTLIVVYGIGADGIPVVLGRGHLVKLAGEDLILRRPAAEYETVGGLPILGTKEEEEDETQEDIHLPFVPGVIFMAAAKPYMDWNRLRGLRRGDSL